MQTIKTNGLLGSNWNCIWMVGQISYTKRWMLILRDIWRKIILYDEPINRKWIVIDILGTIIAQVNSWTDECVYDFRHFPKQMQIICHLSISLWQFFVFKHNYCNFRNSVRSVTYIIDPFTNDVMCLQYYMTNVVNFSLTNAASHCIWPLERLLWLYGE